MIKDILREFIGRKQVEEDKSKSFIPDKERWNMFLEFINSDRISEQQVADLCSVLKKRAKTDLFEELRIKVEEERDYSEDILKIHPKLTPAETKICCYIIQGKSSSEIARLQGIKVSTVTATRCRLRSKLGVKQGGSLKIYLDSISRLKRVSKKQIMQK